MQEVVMPEVGQILYSSWGYDQTNIDFYQIVRVSEKGTVWILPMERVVEQVVGWEQYEVVPGKVKREREVLEYEDKVLSDGYVFRERVSRHVEEIKPSRHKWGKYGVSLNSYAGAWIWDGKPKHMTKYA